MACGICNDTGWVRTVSDSGGFRVSGMARCQCNPVEETSDEEMARIAAMSPAELEAYLAATIGQDDEA